MEHSVGEGSRAPRYRICKITEKTLTVLDQYGQQRRFPKRLPWSNLTKGTYSSNQVVHGKRLLSRFDLRD